MSVSQHPHTQAACVSTVNKNLTKPFHWPKRLVSLKQKTNGDEHIIRSANTTSINGDKQCAIARSGIFVTYLT